VEALSRGYRQGTPGTPGALYRRVHPAERTARRRITPERTMERKNDIAEFLTSRRAEITPEQAGLPTYGKRRVPGLRREEVASWQAYRSSTTSAWSAGT
jgi:hypothetical protein